MKRFWLGLILLLGVACGAPLVYVTGAPAIQTLSGGFSVKADAGWNRLEGKARPEHEWIWTVNGVPLDHVRFFIGIDAGAPLHPSGSKTGKREAVFEARMEPEDIVELFSAFVSADGGNFQLDKLAPCPFAGGDGFRFDFTRIRKGDEVTVKGTGYGRVANGKLYLMVFQAARIHYYAAVFPKVEALAASARID